jgi:hypothetical protein
MNRDSMMCLKIFESLPRGMLEFYYNENALNEWTMPKKEEVIEKFSKLTVQMP